MSRSITTSVRLPPELKNQLEQAAHAMHRGKNWIVVQALQDYLAKLDDRYLAREARRQSILASKQSPPEEVDWEESIDINDQDS